MDVLPVPPARQFEYPRKKCKSDVHACNFNIWRVGQGLATKTSNSNPA